MPSSHPVPPAAAPRPRGPGERRTGTARPRPRRGVWFLALAAALALWLAGSARVLEAHTTLRDSSPADGETVPAGTPEVRFRFNGPVEGQLTRLELVRDGSRLETGPLQPGEPADRAFVLPVPGGLRPGTYTATWRTVGADGHPLSGTFSFVVAPGDEPQPADATEDAPAPPPPAGDAPPPARPMELTDPLPVGLRWAGFLGLLGMIGAVGFRYGVLARMGEAPELRAVFDRALYGAWLLAAAAAALNALTLAGRLWTQSVMLGGAAGALDPDRLRMVVGGTTWGVAWLLESMATVAFFVGLMVVRAPHGRSVGWVGAALSTLLLAAAPALSGHTVAVERLPGVAILSNGLHVLGAGAWLGTLAVVLAVGLPATVYTVPAPRGPAVAAMFRAFSPFAVVASSVVALTGIVNALFHLTAPAELWTEPYGRALLLKVALVGAAAALGFHHWRRVLPRLGGEDSAARIQRTAAAEIAVGVAIVLVTAVLVVLPTPAP